jgi:hypothetical protein
MAWYLKAFGEPPICTVLHWCLWTGGPEPARWMLAAGGKADNCRTHHPSPPLNPAGILGFAFGTSYPYYVYEDAAHGNERLPFLIEPISAYEMGYRAGQGTDFGGLREAIETAWHYHLCMDMFFHPVCIYQYPECREAIDEFVRFTSAGSPSVMMGNDELWRWWEARRQATIEEVAHSEGRLTMTVRCGYSQGMIVMAPTGAEDVEDVRVNGAPASGYETRAEFGGEWLLIGCPPGESRVEVLWREPDPDSPKPRRQR